jgi:hypothetical protein
MAESPLFAAGERLSLFGNRGLTYYPSAPAAQAEQTNQRECDQRGEEILPCATLGLKFTVKVGVRCRSYLALHCHFPFSGRPWIVRPNRTADLRTDSGERRSPSAMA